MLARLQSSLLLWCDTLPWKYPPSMSQRTPIIVSALDCSLARHAYGCPIISTFRWPMMHKATMCGLTTNKVREGIFFFDKIKYCSVFLDLLASRLWFCDLYKVAWSLGVWQTESQVVFRKVDRVSQHQCGSVPKRLPFGRFFPRNGLSIVDATMFPYRMISASRIRIDIYFPASSLQAS